MIAEGQPIVTTLCSNNGEKTLSWLSYYSKSATYIAVTRTIYIDYFKCLTPFWTFHPLKVDGPGVFTHHSHTGIGVVFTEETYPRRL